MPEEPEPPAADRIVASLNGPVSLARSDAGVMVTEYGVADLRGLTLAQRRERMLAVAHPGHRPALEAAAARPRRTTERRIGS